MIRNPEEIFISHKLMEQGYSVERIKREISLAHLESFDQREKDIIENLPKKRKDIIELNVFDYNDVLKNPNKFFDKLYKNSWPIDVGLCVETINPEYSHSKYYQKVYKEN